MASKEYYKAYREANREKIRIKAKVYRGANKEKIIARSKAYYETNTEKIIARSKAYYETNTEEVLAKNKVYREATKDKIKAYREANREKRKVQSKSWHTANKIKAKAYAKAYRKDNKAMLYAHISKRRALKMNQYEKLSADDKFVIEECYELAQLRFKSTGIRWHVDHIIPLSKGGKHHPDNLQVVPAIWNMSKHNRNNDRWLEK